MNRKWGYYLGGGVGLVLALIITIATEMDSTFGVIIMLGGAAIGFLIVWLYYSNKDKSEKTTRERATDETKTLFSLMESASSRDSLIYQKKMDSGNLLFVLKGKGDGLKDYYYFIFKDPNIGITTYDTVSSQYGHEIPTINIYEVDNTWLKYHPSELVYTSVTVGGVTTGGIHDEGNFYTKEHYRSGKYFLSIKTNRKQTLSDDKESKKTGYYAA